MTAVPAGARGARPDVEGQPRTVVLALRTVCGPTVLALLIAVRGLPPQGAPNPYSAAGHGTHWLWRLGRN